MIKIFLVEDEKIVREGIRKGIAWERYGFEFAGEASDGELAFPLIQKAKPDILLTDIRMPFMDGLELAELVKKELPEVRIMFFSGYDEFEYAKRAIRIGAADYLLKPVSSEMLLGALERMSESIVQERNEKEYRNELHRLQEERHRIERDRLFDEIVSGQMNLTEILEEGRKHHLNLSAAAYNLILFQTSITDSQEQYSGDKVNFEAKIQEMIEQEPQIISFNRLTEGYAFLITATDYDRLDEQVSHCRTLLETLSEQMCGLRYFGAIGKPVMRLSEMAECYQSANKAFAHRYLMEPNRVISEQQIHVGEKDSDLSIRHMDMAKLERNTVVTFLKNGSSFDGDYFVEEYFAGCGANINSLIFRQYVLMDMYLAVTSFITQMGLEPEELVEHFGDVDDIQLAVNTAANAIAYSKRLIKKAIELRTGFSQKKYRLVLEKAKDYIRNHYSDEDISLNVVASCVNISPNHFSSIFSQEMGITFVEYLTNTRMEAAKSLMLTTGKRTSEISYEVGYKDPHYFSYLFKKTQGMTPKSFRSGKLEGDCR